MSSESVNLSVVDWKSQFLNLRDQFRQHPSNLWHGVIVGTAGLREGESAWDVVKPHESIARCPAFGRGAIEIIDPPCSWDGTYFGSPEKLLEFRTVATQAFRVLRQSPPYQELAACPRLPASPRDLSGCWLGVLYLLAQSGISALLMGRQRHIANSEKRDKTTPMVHIHFAVLEQDVFASSVAAIELFLSDDPWSSAPLDEGYPEEFISNIVHLPDRPQKRKRATNPTQDARDNWIYSECCNLTPYQKIVVELKRLAQTKSWAQIGTPQGIRAAAIKYAEHHNLDPIPNRQNK